MPLIMPCALYATHEAAQTPSVDLQLKLTTLAAALRVEREKILTDWLATLRIGMEKPGATLTDAELRDHFADLLEDLCNQLELPLTETSELSALKHAETHGDMRWVQSYKLPEIIREIAALRTVVIAVVVAHGHTRLRLQEQSLANIIVHRFFDALVVESATFFAALAQDAALLQERLRTLADAVPQIIWTNSAEGTANYFNRRWYEYTGLTFEESAGPGWQAVVHSKDAAGSDAAWQRALAAGEIFDCEYRLRGADGAYRWFIGRDVPERDAAGRVTGWFGTATDVQELKEAEAAVRENQERLRLIVENAREYAIFTLDLDRSITSWNSGAQAILGYTAEETIGQSGDIIFTPEDRAAGVPETETQTARTEGKASDERWHLRKDQSRFWGSGVMMAMHDSRGEAIGLVKIFRDQTEQLRAQQALEKALAEAERARAEAESAGKAKDHFLAVLSHELRTPLTPIKMIAATVARRKNLPEGVADALATIERNVNIEAALIDDLLDITRVSRGKLEIVPVPVDLRTVIEHAAQVSQPEIDEKAQNLSITIEPGDYPLAGDPMRLQQVFWNLLKNASKFTPEGGNIHVRARHKKSQIIIDVSDTGIGFEPELAEKLFDPFFQANLRITQEHGGLGLGLAICKAIVESHGGTIRAAAHRGESGATFTVILPLSRT